MSSPGNRGSLPKPNKAHVSGSTKIKSSLPSAGHAFSHHSKPSSEGTRKHKSKGKARMENKQPDLDATRSENDKKHYRLKTLPNGLECLVISTLDAHNSLVGVDVAPGERPGTHSVAIPSSMDLAKEEQGHDVRASRPASLVKEFTPSNRTSMNVLDLSNQGGGADIYSIPTNLPSSNAELGLAGDKDGVSHHKPSASYSGPASSDLDLEELGRAASAATGKPRSRRPSLNVMSNKSSAERHRRIDSTKLVVEQIHAKAITTSQLNLNEESSEVVENATAQALRPGLHIRTASQGSLVTGAVSPTATASAPATPGSVRKSKPMGFSSLTREQGKSVSEARHSKKHRNRASSRSCGSINLSKPSEERRRSLGRRRQSIPSLTLSSTALTSSNMAMHNPLKSYHHGHTHSGCGTPTGSSMNLFDVPHLDHTSSKRVVSTSALSSAGVNTEEPASGQVKEVGIRMAAVSLAVGVGSFSTPDGFDGLAHFLEHMLFMGSEKFRTENAFDAFLAQAGGNSNAYTDTEKTVYHFTCPQEHLREALDIFAQFFIAPLLLPEAMERELKSIESEFTLRQNMDGCRLQEIWRHTSRKDTPFSKFTCGNAQTLRDWPAAAGRDVNKAMWEFYKRYYVAPNMKLCILGIDSLDALEELATGLFSAVRSQPSPQEPHQEIDFSEKGVPWVGTDPSVQSLAQVWPQIIRAQRERKNLPDVLNQLETERVKERKKSARQRKASREAAKSVKVGQNGVALGCLFRIIPVQDMHELSLTWQLPPLAGLYMSKPTEYISHLIGHESSGSILAEAKARGWATALIASSTTGDGFEHNTACTMFNINITLSRQGLSEWVFVVGMVFEYIGMLIRTGPQKWVWDELRAVSKMQYRFQEEPDALMLAQNLSVWMLPQSKYKQEHLLTGPWLNFEWDPVLITNTLHQLSPKLVRVDLMSSVFGHSSSSSGGGGGGGDEFPKAGDDVPPEPPQNSPKPSNKSSSSSSSSKRKDGKKKKDSRKVRFSEEIKPGATIEVPEADKEPAASNGFDSVHLLGEKPTRSPEVEPFTGAQYWVDKIPKHVVGLWKELFMGRATVGFTETSNGDDEAAAEPSKKKGSTNLFPRSLALPPRNPYISTSFSLKPYPTAKFAHHPLTNASIRVKLPMVKYASLLANLPKNSAGGGSSNSRNKRQSKLRQALISRTNSHNAGRWVNARILEFNEADNMILVRYPLGEYRWHQLPVDKVDWKSMPSPSAKRISLLKKLMLDSNVEFQLVHIATSNPALQDGYRSAADSVESLDTETSLLSNDSKGFGSTASSTSSRSNDDRYSLQHGKQMVAKTGKKLMGRRRAAPPGKGSAPVDVNMVDLALDSDLDATDSGFESFPVLPRKSRTPAMVSKSDNLVTLWHLHDQQFLTPRCEVFLNFVSPVASASPLMASLHDLLALMIFESLNQDSYMAFISELELEIETSGTGLQVHVGGFSHKLPVLLDNVLNRLLQFAMFDIDPAIVQEKLASTQPQEHSVDYSSDEENKSPKSLSPTQLVESPVFYAQLESLVINYINAGSQFRSSGQVSTAMFQILCRDLWSPDVKVSFASYITPDLLKEYAVKFFAECRVVGLVHGNVTLGESQHIMAKVRKALEGLDIKPVPEDNIPVLKVMRVPVSPPPIKSATLSGMVHVLEALESPAHSVELYFQIGDDTLEDRVLACSIEQLMKEPLYAELRTKQQLGYSVKCGVRSICGTLGFVVEITSEVHGPELLCQDVDKFFVLFRTMLVDMTTQLFNQNISALARNLLEKENGLSEATLKFWGTITNKQYFMPKRYAWNYELEQARKLRKIATKERILDRFDKWLNPASTQRRRLSVLVVGYGYDTTNLVRMLDLPCVTIVETSRDGRTRNGGKACKCSVM